MQIAHAFAVYLNDRHFTYAQIQMAVQTSEFFCVLCVFFSLDEPAKRIISSFFIFYDSEKKNAIFYRKKNLHFFEFT